MAGKTSAGKAKDSTGGDTEFRPSSPPVVPAPGRRRALLMLPLALLLEAIGILLLAMGHVWPFIILMVSGIVLFAGGTIALFRIARGRGL
ncbi:hypothetical protein [Oceanibium sediminis]|uniref:hypothetical protein n=1 Tax=Oceanibium sediminis TaxID=2026339 RepID=UPI000DD2DBB0|nr:hypothetical protein [Oceanibium sediminis]